VATTGLPVLTDEVKSALLDCTCINLRVAARVVTRLYDEALEPSGIRITQLATLAVLTFYGPFTVKALANALVMDRTTLTADLKPLETRELVLIAPGADRRTRIVSVTPAGQAVLVKAIPLWQSTQQVMNETLGAVRLETLLVNLREVVHAAQRR
jgi:DNA-binding MarR family transcriptional regulator